MGFDRVWTCGCLIGRDVISSPWPRGVLFSIGFDWWLAKGRIKKSKTLWGRIMCLDNCFNEFRHGFASSVSLIRHDSFASCFWDRTTINEHCAWLLTWQNGRQLWLRACFSPFSVPCLKLTTKRVLFARCVSVASSQFYMSEPSPHRPPWSCHGWCYFLGQWQVVFPSFAWKAPPATIF
jgi:hypothetical protein